ncbi:MAG TPA: type II toxin-antitoxin system HicB family antitoxin [bacterium]|nr:type II toxin-antitoxin system HicB family antitoxin [bacterium]
MKYTVIIEKGASSYGAYVPDLPGCIAAGETAAEALSLIKEAIVFHLEGLKEEGREAPEPHSYSAIVDVNVTAI